MCAADVMYLLLHRGLWFRTGREACWLTHCTLFQDVFSGHLAFLDFPSLTYYVVGHTKSVTKSFDSIINGKQLVSSLVWGRETKDCAYGKFRRQCFRVLVTYKPELRLFICICISF